MNQRNRPSGLTLFEAFLWIYVLAAIPITFELHRLKSLRVRNATSGFIQIQNGNRIYWLTTEKIYYYGDSKQLTSAFYVNAIKIISGTYLFVTCLLGFWVVKRSLMKLETRWYREHEPERW